MVVRAAHIRPALAEGAVRPRELNRRDPVVQEVSAEADQEARVGEIQRGQALDPENPAHRLAQNHPLVGFQAGVLNAGDPDELLDDGAERAVERLGDQERRSRRLPDQTGDLPQCLIPVDCPVLARAALPGESQRRADPIRVVHLLDERLCLRAAPTEIDREIRIPFDLLGSPLEDPDDDPVATDRERGSSGIPVVPPVAQVVRVPGRALDLELVLRIPIADRPAAGEEHRPGRGGRCQLEELSSPHPHLHSCRAGRSVVTHRAVGSRAVLLVTGQAVTHAQIADLLHARLPHRADVAVAIGALEAEVEVN
ncbi:hypothetical protein HRbin26_00889 [bacterium HR26]|nr:hypothetical protein HRbin26_00889 [bacterium HR26]